MTVTKRNLDMQAFDLSSGIEEIPAVRVMLNIGCGLDIPTGTFHKGVNKHKYLNGGMGQITGVVANGNAFKSTLIYYMIAAALNILYESVSAGIDPTKVHSKDTENHVHVERMTNLTRRFKKVFEANVVLRGIWNIADKNLYYANEWWKLVQDFLNNKRENKKKYMAQTPFLDRDNKTPISIVVPTFSSIDSLSQFEPEGIAVKNEASEMGSTDNQTMFMQLGLAKTKFFNMLPTILGRANDYMLFTGQLGDKIEMGGPYAPQPLQKLHYLKNYKIKGVSDQFTYLLSNCWYIKSAGPYFNDNKGPEYPANSNDNDKGDTDLTKIVIQQLRGKHGPSGFMLTLVASQHEGILPELTEFDMLRSNQYFGLGGSKQNYFLHLYPECKLQRTTVRSKIDSGDIKLKNAIHYTLEIMQMQQFYRQYDEDFLCNPDVLYEDLTKKGYDWDKILESRPYWVFDEEKHPVKFLSSMDLLDMRAGTHEFDDSHWKKKG